MIDFNFDHIPSFKRGILKVGDIYKTKKKGFNNEQEFFVITIIAKKGTWAWFGGHLARKEKIAAKIMIDFVKKYPETHVVIDFFGIIYEKSEYCKFIIGDKK